MPILSPAPGSRNQEQGKRGTDSELRVEEEEKSYRNVHSDRKPGIQKDRDPMISGPQRYPAGEDRVKAGDLGYIFWSHAV